MSQPLPPKASLDGLPVAIAQFEQVLGVPAIDEALLREAITHPSWVVEHPEDAPNNQRLEFLGDSVLGMLVVEALFERHTGQREGLLSRWKSELVSTTALAAWAEQQGIGAWLRLGRGEEKEGGRGKASILADVTEALIAAVYRAHGLAVTRQLVRAMIEPKLAVTPVQHVPVDSKSRLQIEAQRRWKRAPTYTVQTTEGLDHERVFTVQVQVTAKQVWTGQGRSRQAAEQDAAANALDALGVRAPA